MIPFNSETKKMTVIVELSDTLVRVYTKGASENLIDDCASILDKNHTQVVDLDLNKRDQIKESVLKIMA